MEKIILDSPRGGIGDALLYSTLPERYANLGHEVYLSTRSQMRNAEAHQLVWGDNPFVGGILSGVQNAGSTVDFTFFTTVRYMPNPIEAMERAHGFEPSGRRFPKIYYTPKYLPEWKDVIVADPRSHSQGFPVPMFDEFADFYFPGDNITVVESRFAGQNGNGALAHCPRHLLRDIYEWCDIIASCKAFLVTESGGQSVAAAVREDKNTIFVLATQTTNNSKFFIYPELHYHITGRLGPDYHPSIEKP